MLFSLIHKRCESAAVDHVDVRSLLYQPLSLVQIAGSNRVDKCPPTFPLRARPAAYADHRLVIWLRGVLYELLTALHPIAVSALIPLLRRIPFLRCSSGRCIDPERVAYFAQLN